MPGHADALTGLGGLLQTVQGGMMIGAGIATSEFGIGIPIAAWGSVTFFHGIDSLQAATNRVRGIDVDSFTVRKLQSAGMDQKTAKLTDAAIGVALSGGALVALKWTAFGAAMSSGWNDIFKAAGIVSIIGQGTQARQVLSQDAPNKATGETQTAPEPNP